MIAEKRILKYFTYQGANIVLIRRSVGKVEIDLTIIATGALMQITTHSAEPKRALATAFAITNTIIDNDSLTFLDTPPPRL